MLKIVNIEGLNDHFIKILMKKVKDRLAVDGKRAEIVMFPRLGEKSAYLIEKHLNEFPKIDYSKKIAYNDLTNFDNKIVFVLEKDTGFTKVAMLKTLQNVEDVYLLENLIDDTSITITKSNFKNYTLFESRDNNLFKQGVKADPLAKANLFTVDRNVWFNNNHERIFNNLDYLLVNRSYLSNIFYRVEDYNPNAFILYASSLVFSEIRASKLGNAEFHNYFVKDEEFYNHIDMVKSIYLGEGKELDAFERDLQYCKTIHENSAKVFEAIIDIQSADLKNMPIVAALYNNYRKYIDINYLLFEKQKKSGNLLISERLDDIAYRIYKGIK